MTRIAAFGVIAFGLVACGEGAPRDAPSVTRGAALFAQYCVACHGATGVGDGPEAGARKPADLTQLRARNGGVYPAVRVMGQVYGYSLGTAQSPAMPEFGPLLEGDTVLVETDEGVLTPTPSRLVDIADYVASLQK